MFPKIQIWKYILKKGFKIIVFIHTLLLFKIIFVIL